MNTIDDSTAAVLGLVVLFAGVGLYVWTALALGAVFRKSGEEAWKGWVPIYNQAIVLRLGGLSPWLLLLYLVPVAGATVVWVFLIVACHAINRAFGLGGGMTVLAALLFPVWASVLGWGSARWVGRERRGSWQQDRQDAAPATMFDDALPPRPSMPPMPPTLPVEFASPAAAYEPSTAVPSPAAWAPEQASPGPVAGAAAPPLPPPPRMPAATAAAAAAGARPGVDGDAGPSDDDGVISMVPYSRPRATDQSESFEERGSSGEHGARPSVFPPMAVDDDDEWEDTNVPSSELPPVAAVRAPHDTFDGPPPGVLRRSGSGQALDEATLPPVTRVPAAPPAGPERDPWAPTEDEPFPETSGPVSAVVGAPEAGSPRSARTSVSAYHARPEIPDENDDLGEDDDLDENDDLYEDDDLDETVIARRRRTNWALVLPSGDPIALTAEVVLVGRRPAARAEHPGAQLVAVDDGTVSKTHALLQLRDDRWYITDLDSTNGVIFATLVGTEVEATPGVETEAGDRFLLGDAEVRLVRSDG